MRTFIIFFLLQILMFEVCFGQHSIDTNKTSKPMVGFNLGLLSSHLIDDSKTNPNHSYNPNEVVLDSNFGVGFNLGVFVSFINSKHFSFQPEINYNLSKQRINYHYSNSSHWGDYNETSADYLLYISTLQLSFSAKYKFGKKIRYYIGFGPFFNMPLDYSAKGRVETIGTKAVMQHINDSISFPIPQYMHELAIDNSIPVQIENCEGLFFSTGFFLKRKKNFLGVDLRLYYCKQYKIEFIKSSYMYLTLNLTYQLKPKRNKY